MKNRRKLASEYTYYIIPIVNPDGYEYSRKWDRFWRKTRSFNYKNFFCPGVDLNRNFGYQWNTGGSSKFPCSQVYHGHYAESEPETQALTKFLKSKSIDLYLTLHTFGQMWLSVWGYTKDDPSDIADLKELGDMATDAIRGNSGKTYISGTSAQILGVASGGSDDWAKEIAGVKYSYTVELRDDGYYGFIAPAKEIAPTGEEMHAAITKVAEYLTQLPKTRTSRQYVQVPTSKGRVQYPPGNIRSRRRFSSIVQRRWQYPTRHSVQKK